MTTNRDFNVSGFIKSTVAPLLHSRGDTNERPVLGIDECLNDKYIETMARRLVADGLVSTSSPMWWTENKTRSGGERFLILGSSISKSARLPYRGRPIQGQSWPDERVVAYLVAHFLSNDRLCLLTSDLRKDRPEDLGYILETEVGHTLEAITPKRLGLLVLAKMPGTILHEYVSAVESRLRTRTVNPGFCWEEL